MTVGLMPFWIWYNFDKGGRDLLKAMLSSKYAPQTTMSQLFLQLLVAFCIPATFNVQQKNLVDVHCKETLIF